MGKGTGLKILARVTSLEQLQVSVLSEDVEGMVHHLTQILIDSVRRKFRERNFFKGERVREPVNFPNFILFILFPRLHFSSLYHIIFIFLRFYK